MEGKWLYLGDLSLQFGDSLCPLLQSLLQLWDFSGSQLRQLQQREREGSPTLLLNQEMPSHLLNLWFEFLQLFLPLLLVLKLRVQLWEKLRNTLIQTVRYLLGGGGGIGKSQLHGTIPHKGGTTLYHVSFPSSHAQGPGNKPTL